MTSNGECVRGGGEDDERADEIGERCMAAKSNGTERGGHESGENG